MGSYEDELIGVLITQDYLDIPGRLYADIFTVISTNEETGDVYEAEKFVFSKLTGIPYFSPVIAANGEHESYTTTMSDDAISNGHIHINIGDDHNSKTMTGTIFITPSGTGHTFYFNPVYQSADGSVFTEPGDAISMSGVTAIGSAMSKTLDVVTSVTENGVTKTNSFSISISISIIPTPEKINILQMSAENVLVSQADYKPGEVPENYSPKTDTAYIIVETHSRDKDSSDILTREIFDRGDEYFETFYARADGVCIKLWTQLIWE